jgi:hypothetical protein
MNDRLDRRGVFIANPSKYQTEHGRVDYVAAFDGESIEDCSIDTGYWNVD